MHLYNKKMEYVKVNKNSKSITKKEYLCTLIFLHYAITSKFSLHHNRFFKRNLQ